MLALHRIRWHLPMINFIATCPKNIEGLLADELRTLGITDIRETFAAVYFSGDLAHAYRACLWSRFANRIILILGTFPVTTVDSLYDAVKSLPWEEHLEPSGTLRIDFNGVSEAIRHTHFGAQKVKDAIVDGFRDKTGERPNIDLENPDVRVNAHLHHDNLTLGIDLSGDSLHRRGYRLQAGEAPLKENLAAAVLTRAKWPELASQGAPLIDPLCGSGTLLIEAGLIAADIAPGLLRQQFGFHHWLGHDAALWRTIWDEAWQRREMGLQKSLPDIRGYDGQPKSIVMARENIARAGLSDVITVSVRELAKLVRPTHGTQASGLIIANPPYGERLETDDSMGYFYRHLGERLKEEFVNWELAILTGNPLACKKLDVRSYKQYPFFNGALAVKLLLFHLTSEWFFAARKGFTEPENNLIPVTVENSATQMLVNRITKNQKKLQSWRKQQDIRCYRLYDADLPEYAFALDIYESWAHVQEYAPPITIDKTKAEDRLSRAVAILPSVLGIPASHIIVKQRQRHKDKKQYEKQSDEKQLVSVTESRLGIPLLINLTDYVDTGLFLDHRKLRQQIYERAKGKTFLNLFCYTAAASVYAAKGGARRTVSVDMSATYLLWARRNFALNGLSSSLHQLVQEDCLAWLDKETEKFDIIYLDPPTFSNSKRMQETLDIQRDQVRLVSQAMRLLKEDGVLFFSNHRQQFKLNREEMQQFHFQEITNKTIDMDFKLSPPAHYCWEVTWKN